ncbi:MAG TPA: hypothetical protein EYN66_07330 [Myxococcales bacterium]|nr:hypothetical protein [Myxococcales bacterium]
MDDVKKPGRKLPRRPPPGGEGAAEYLAWLGAVPEDERHAISDILSSIQVRTYDDLMCFSQRVLVEILAGRITPSVASEARGWAELMMLSIAAKNAMQGTPASAYGDLINALEDVKDTSSLIEASYTTEFELDPPVVSDEEKVVEVAK